MIEYKLERDKIWEIFIGLDTYQDFCELSGSFELDKNVPEDVQNRYGLVTKLIKHSYYEYEFLEVALSRAFSSFEFALKTRVSDLIEDDAYEKELGNLIDIAASRSLFDIDKQRVHNIREIRNDFIHTNRNQQFGTLALNAIREIKEIIEGLYEDKELRIDRKREERKINKILSAKFKNGGFFKSPDKKILLVNLRLAKIDNKKEVNLYTFLFSPIFQIPKKTDSFSIKDPIVIKTDNYSFINDKLIIQGKSEKVVVTILEKHQRKKVKEWRNKLFTVPIVRHAAVIKHPGLLDVGKKD